MKYRTVMRNEIPTLSSQRDCVKGYKFTRITPLLTIFFLSLVVFDSYSESINPLNLLPKDARNALDQRIKSQFGKIDYTVVAVKKSESGKSWCIVFEPPLKGKVAGTSLLFDYAAISPDRNSWKAVMIEDHRGGIVLDMFYGCKAVYKRPSK